MGRIHGALITTVLCLASLGFAQAPHRVAVHAGHVLDVKSGKTLSDQVLVIEDGKIVSNGAAADAKIPADAVRIEFVGKPFGFRLRRRRGLGTDIGAGGIWRCRRHLRLRARRTILQRNRRACLS